MKTAADESRHTATAAAECCRPPHRHETPSVTPTCVDLTGCTILLTAIPAGHTDDKRLREREASRQLIVSAFGKDARCRHYPDGAPYVEGHESTPVSLSHSDSTCVLAISRGSLSIGVDIERPRTQLERVAAKFLNVRELERLSSVTSPDSRIDFLLHEWTAKEAVYKAARTPGLGLAEINVSPDFRHAEARGTAYSLSYLASGGDGLLCVALRH